MSNVPRKAALICLARQARVRCTRGIHRNAARESHQMNKTVFIAIASLFGLASCAGMDTEGLKVKCDVGPVSVFVTGKIVGVGQDPIPVLKQNQWICWQLDSNAAGSYMFFDESISVDDTDNEFDNCKANNKKGVMQGDTLIACLDKNNKHGAGDVRYYKYTMTLKRRDGTPGPKSYDPQIGND